MGLGALWRCGKSRAKQNRHGIVRSTPREFWPGAVFSLIVWVIHQFGEEVIAVSYPKLAVDIFDVCFDSIFTDE